MIIQQPTRKLCAVSQKKNLKPRNPLQSSIYLGNHCRKVAPWSQNLCQVSLSITVGLSHVPWLVKAEVSKWKAPMEAAKSWPSSRLILLPSSRSHLLPMTIMTETDIWTTWPSSLAQSYYIKLTLVYICSYINKCARLVVGMPQKWPSAILLHLNLHCSDAYRYSALPQFYNPLFQTPLTL